MQKTLRFAPLLSVLLLAACSSSPNYEMQAQPAPIQATPAIAPVVVEPVQPVVVAANAATAGDASAFIDAGAFAKLSGGERAEAASAQYNALMFGRPGAPRNWGKSGGTAGAVTVGPYVRVNNTDCRNFTHVVTIGGTPFSKQGTACKDPVGNWTVAG